MLVPSTPENDWEIERMTSKVMELALVHGLRTVDCLLYPVHGSEPRIVPVLVDQGCDTNPRAIDLNPECYLHKDGAEGRQVIVLDRSSVRVERFPRTSKVLYNDVYRVFYSRDDECYEKKRGNLLLSRMVATPKDFWGNALVVREGRDGTVRDMRECDIKLADRIAIMVLMEEGVNQTRKDT
ncbi:hypothetical protein CC2G_000234 [Coprinopsis cinerea AmutBmut pab1-1]|nr:hypothetical protein CC2G_000234 [Coprinopsis cinerea AmutBmut pab1-1]